MGAKGKFIPNYGFRDANSTWCCVCASATPGTPEREVLLSFHTVAKGKYPQSLSGAHFSQQLFRADPADGSLARDYYRDFYADNFADGQVRAIQSSSISCWCGFVCRVCVTCEPL